MPCPDSGKITIQDLVNEFGGTAPHTLTEYYRNGSLVPGNNTNVPESGQISLTQFYSAVNEIIHTHSSNATNQNYATIFGSNWASSVPKRIVINSGVTIGGTSGNAAMTIPSGMGGTLIIDNNGHVHGHGGSANGGTGGNAIHCVSTAVTINNNSGATIKAGGGGGGQGGTGGRGGNGGNGGNGGQGRYSYLMCSITVGFSGSGTPHSAQARINACNNSNGDSSSNCGSGAAYGTYGGTAGYGYGYAIHRVHCYNYAYTNGGSGGAGGSSGGAGGAGGAGGRGQGYNQSAQNGSGGSAGSAGGSGSGGGSGGTNAGNGGAGGARGQGGTGGTGGNGGSFGNAGQNGNSGATGNTGASGSSGSNGNISNGSGGSSGSGGLSGSSGSAGGSAGYYIYNRSSITFNSLAGSSTAGN